MNKYGYTIWIFFFSLSFAFGQSPYRLKIYQEVAYYGTGLTSIAAGRYLTTGSPFFTTDELETLNPNDVNRLDRIAINQFSQFASDAGDIILYTSFITPHLFLIPKKTRDHYNHIITLYGEAILINAGVTMMTKSLFRRPRPYAFSESITDEYKLSRRAKTSFVSGHTSFVATNSFFAAKVFSDFYPDSEWKPIVWITAAALPAATGTFRITAGRHYPTDVIAGYALGATIGILIPHLHRHTSLADKGVQIDVWGNGGRIVWQF
jgi:membrane-associated phospholipid phosphatase